MLTINVGSWQLFGYLLLVLHNGCDYAVLTFSKQVINVELGTHLYTLNQYFG